MGIKRYGRALKYAEKNNLIVILPKEDECFVDIDSEVQYGEFLVRLAKLYKMEEGVEVRYTLNVLVVIGVVVKHFSIRDIANPEFDPKDYLLTYINYKFGSVTNGIKSGFKLHSFPKNDVLGWLCHLSNEFKFVNDPLYDFTIDLINVWLSIGYIVMINDLERNVSVPKYAISEKFLIETNLYGEYFDGKKWDFHC